MRYVNRVGDYSAIFEECRMLEISKIYESMSLDDITHW